MPFIISAPVFRLGLLQILVKTGKYEGGTGSTCLSVGAGPAPPSSGGPPVGELGDRARAPLGWARCTQEERVGLAHEARCIGGTMKS